MNKVKMVQTLTYRWEIISTKNNSLIKGDIYLNSEYHAEQYVKAYISSFRDWSYEMVPLEKDIHEKK